MNKACKPCPFCGERPERFVCDEGYEVCDLRCPDIENCTQSTDTQQLKAEIAAIVERLQRAYAMRESPDVLDCISELRQLSAV